MDTTQTPQPSTSGEEKPRRRFVGRLAIATAIAGLASGIGITAFAQGGGHGGWHRGGFMGTALDPAMVDERHTSSLPAVPVPAADALGQLFPLHPRARVPSAKFC